MVIIESAQVIFNMKKVRSGLDFFKVPLMQRLTGERFFQVFFMRLIIRLSVVDVSRPDLILMRFLLRIQFVGFTDHGFSCCE